ncbi:hypothetical protein [Streptomonospora sediminis]
MFDELRRLGMARVYGSADPKMSVLSLPGGVTVWVVAGAFTWRDAVGRAVWWEADDVAGAARRLVGQVQQGRAAGGDGTDYAPAVKASEDFFGAAGGAAV